MDGLARGVELLFIILKIAFIAGFPIMFGLGVLLGWLIWH